MSKGRGVAILGLGIAAGTALGFFVLAPNVQGGPGSGAASIQRQLDDEKQVLDATEKQLQASDEVLAASAPKLVAGTLRDRSVALIVMPGARESDVKTISKLITDAGGQISGTLTVADKALDPANGDEVKSLAASSLPAGAKLSESKLDPGTHTGQLIGSAIAANRAGAIPGTPVAGQSGQSGQDGALTPRQIPDSDREVALGALTRAGFISGGPVKPADVAVVITGSGEPGQDSSGQSSGGDSARAPQAWKGDTYAATFTADLAAGLDSRMSGVVLAGDYPSAGPNAPLSTLRSDQAQAQVVSTVDNADHTVGAISVVRAVRQQYDGRAGHYGSAEGATAATPASPAAPTPPAS